MSHWFRGIFILRVAILSSRPPREGGRVRTFFLCDSLFVLHGCIMDLAWDPDRYDQISICRVFSVTWCLWNHTEFSAVVTFAFLEVGDLYCFCSTAYCIYLDFPDIREELERYNRHLRNGRS